MKRNTTFYVLGGLCVMAAAYAIWPCWWIAMPLEGRVLDASAKGPVAGATVAVIWPLEGGPLENVHVGVLGARELTTDETGRFRDSWWGPRFAFGWGSIYSDQPRIVVSKDGYNPTVIGQYRLDRHRVWAFLHTAPVGVELRPAQSRRESDSAIHDVQQELTIAMANARPCQWAEIEVTQRRFFEGTAGKEHRSAETQSSTIARSIEPCSWFNNVLGGAR